MIVAGPSKLELPPTIGYVGSASNNEVYAKFVSRKRPSYDLPMISL